MPDSAARDPKPQTKREKDPNLYRVVIASAVILLLFMLGAWLVFMHWGRRLTPPVKPNPEPHSLLVMPAPQRPPLTLA